MKSEKIKSIIKIICGSLLVAIALNLFLVNQNLPANGLYGFAYLYSYKAGWSFGLLMLIINIFFLALGFLTIKKQVKDAILGSILIPIFTILTSNTSVYIDFSGAEVLLLTVYGGVLMGIGLGMIYKEGFYPGASDILRMMNEEVFGPDYKIIDYGLDLLILVCTYAIFGTEICMYSLIVILIIEVLCNRYNVGVSNAKIFYIITSEEKQVKDYIMNTLHYDITIFDVKGGFSKNKNKVLMTAIPTKDYYKLRENIKDIDPNAFISITDSYEVVNDSLEVQNKLKGDS